MKLVKRSDKVLDDLDRKILDLLKENCLTPFVRIAEMLGVAEGTIRQRVRKLQASGAIKRFTVETDPDAIGLESLAFVLLTVSPKRIRSVGESLAEIPAVLEVHEVHSYGDFLLKIRTTNLTELATLISDQIKTIRGVVGTQIVPVLRAWKE